MNTTPLVLLVVDDNEDDVYFMRRALRTAAPHADVRFVSDGQAALDYLRRDGAFADETKHPRPAVTFLDLKLPYVHGLDVLAAVRKDPSLHEQRIIILTSSSEERDRTRAVELGVQGYLVKPPTPPMLIEALAPHAPSAAGR